jgi:hypothetical protein
MYWSSILLLGSQLQNFVTLSFVFAICEHSILKFFVGLLLVVNARHFSILRHNFTFILSDMYSHISCSQNLLRIFHLLLQNS